MTRGTEFLNVVTEKIKKKIREIGETIQTVRKDIEGMNEYYWENYTEMDQYGYENFDNQQALLNQINANAQQHSDDAHNAGINVEIFRNAAANAGNHAGAIRTIQFFHNSVILS